MSRRTRLLLMVAGGLTLWFGLTLALWAFRPLTDSVPVGLNADKIPVSQEVKCNNLFQSNPHDEAAPFIPSPLRYERVPCVAVHREARIVFAIDTVLYVAGLAAVAAIGLRGRRVLRATVTAFA
jgi:hypothetical protein